jgi:ParB family chromosome partitioning protein
MTEKPKEPRKPRAKKAEGAKTTRSRKGKPAPASIGLTAAEVGDGSPPEEVLALGRGIEEQGGKVLGMYRDPLGGHWQMVASLPIDIVQPTPFQRDLSETHVGRLTDVIGRMGRYLDPIVVVRNERNELWTPNGHHRLAAMRGLGARAILAVVVPESAVAYQILAMNTEKGHNLREKSLEVIRMARSLLELETRPEKELSLEFEEPAFLTLGIAYEQRGRLSGGAYHPVLKRVEVFLDSPLPGAVSTRTDRAARLLELDDLVAEAVAKLKDRGLTSPYLKTFVVARINPLRFRRGATMDPDEALRAMTDAAARFDAEKVRPGDLANAFGAGGGEE